jgi:hypothetical protein
MMTIRHLAGASYVDMLRIHGVSRQAVFKHVQKVVSAIADNKDTGVVAWPETSEECEEFASQWAGKSGPIACRGLHQTCIGAIDRVLIEAKSPAKKETKRPNDCRSGHKKQIDTCEQCMHDTHYQPLLSKLLANLLGKSLGKCALLLCTNKACTMCCAISYDEEVCSSSSLPALLSPLLASDDLSFVVPMRPMLESNFSALSRMLRTTFSEAPFSSACFAATCISVINCATSAAVAGEQLEDMVVTVGAVDGDKKSSTLAVKKQRRW